MATPSARDTLNSLEKLGLANVERLKTERSDLIVRLRDIDEELAQWPEFFENLANKRRELGLEADGNQ